MLKFNQDKPQTQHQEPVRQPDAPAVPQQPIAKVAAKWPVEHKYARDNALGGWTCSACHKHIVVPGDLYLKTCTAP